VTPKKGVFQGDIMHTPDDVHDNDGRVHFTPNTITYSAARASAQGQAALNSKIGVAVHTKYNGNNLEDMQAEHGADVSEFGLHRDVHLISTAHRLDNIKYTPQNRERFAKAMAAAAAANKKTKPETYEAIKGHEIPLKTYINHTVRTGTRPNVEGFMNHYIKSQQKRVDSVKTEKAKAVKTAEMETAIGHVQRNRAHFENVLNQHKALQKAKDVLTNTLSSNSEFDHSINGKKTKPEGFVVVRHNRPTKFVDRADFSAANFNKVKTV
jgi:hypothetical protein